MQLKDTEKILKQKSSDVSRKDQELKTLKESTQKKENEALNKVKAAEKEKEEKAKELREKKLALETVRSNLEKVNDELRQRRKLESEGKDYNLDQMEKFQQENELKMAQIRAEHERDLKERKNLVNELEAGTKQLHSKIADEQMATQEQKQAFERKATECSKLQTEVQLLQQKLEKAEGELSVSRQNAISAPPPEKEVAPPPVQPDPAVVQELEGKVTVLTENQETLEAQLNAERKKVKAAEEQIQNWETKCKDWEKKCEDLESHNAKRAAGDSDTREKLEKSKKELAIYVKENKEFAQKKTDLESAVSAAELKVKEGEKMHLELKEEIHHHTEMVAELQLSSQQQTETITMLETAKTALQSENDTLLREFNEFKAHQSDAIEKLREQLQQEKIQQDGKTESLAEITQLRGDLEEKAVLLAAKEAQLGEAENQLRDTLKQLNDTKEELNDALKRTSVIEEHAKPPEQHTEDEQGGEAEQQGEAQVDEPESAAELQNGEWETAVAQQGCEQTNEVESREGDHRSVAELQALREQSEQELIAIKEQSLKDLRELREKSDQELQALQIRSEEGLRMLRERSAHELRELRDGSDKKVLELQDRIRDLLKDQENLAPQIAPQVAAQSPRVEQSRSSVDIDRMGFYASDLESRIIRIQELQEREAIVLAEESASKLELESAIQAYEDYNESLMDENKVLTRNNTDLKMRLSEYDTILDSLQSRMRDATNGSEDSGKGLLSDCLAEIHRREDFLSNAKATLTVARIQKNWVNKFRANKLAKQAVATAAGPIIEQILLGAVDSASQQTLEEPTPVSASNENQELSEEADGNAFGCVEGDVEAVTEAADAGNDDRQPDTEAEMLGVVETKVAEPEEGQITPFEVEHAEAEGTSGRLGGQGALAIDESLRPELTQAGVGTSVELAVDETAIDVPVPPGGSKSADFEQRDDKQDNRAGQLLGIDKEPDTPLSETEALFETEEDPEEISEDVLFAVRQEKRRKVREQAAMLVTLQRNLPDIPSMNKLREANEKKIQEIQREVGTSSRSVCFTPSLTTLCVSQIVQNGGWRSALFLEDGSVDLDLDLTTWSKEDQIQIFAEMRKFLNKRCETTELKLQTQTMELRRDLTREKQISNEHKGHVSELEAELVEVRRDLEEAETAKEAAAKVEWPQVG